MNTYEHASAEYRALSARALAGDPTLGSVQGGYWVIGDAVSRAYSRMGLLYHTRNAPSRPPRREQRRARKRRMR